jgi:two-component system, cell cycle sensor histidine kinase and response regulator CckA
MMKHEVSSTMEMDTTEQPNTTPAAPNGVRVLVIDDKEEFHGIFKDLLEPLGFTVKGVANPVKALELFTRDKNCYDLVMLDYFMPQLDGGKTFEWLRKLNPNIKVIICSGAEELRLRQIKAQYAIDAYIRKPFRNADMVRVIQQVMGLPITK